MRSYATWCGFFATTSAGILTGTYFAAKKASQICSQTVTYVIDPLIAFATKIPANTITATVTIPDTSIELNVLGQTVNVPFPSQTMPIEVATPEVPYSVLNNTEKYILDNIENLPGLFSDICEDVTWAAGVYFLLVALSTGTGAIYSYYNNKAAREAVSIKREEPVDIEAGVLSRGLSRSTQ